MATVIQDFTVEPKATPPSEAGKPAAAAGGDEKPSEPMKREMANALRREQIRALRLWAH